MADPIKDKRRHKRIYINEKAEMLLDNRSYSGYIVNVSESGLSFMFSSLFHVRDDTAQNRVVTLSTEMLKDLDCEVVWIKKGAYAGNTVACGMKVIEPSTAYMDWVKTH